MSAFIVLPLGILLLTLKIMVFSSLPMYECAPDLLIVFCVFTVLHSKGKQAIYYSWYLGLLRDIASCEQFGMYSLIFAFSGFLLVRFKEEFFFDHVIFVTLLAFAFSVQCNLIHACVISFLYDGDVFANVFPSALYTAIASPPLFILLNALIVRGEDEVAQNRGFIR